MTASTNNERTNLKMYVHRYDDNTWLQLVKNAVAECVADGVPVNVLNVEERLKDLFGVKIGKVYFYERKQPDRTLKPCYEACHKNKIRKALKQLAEYAGALS